jgi:hypothetical protein
MALLEDRSEPHPGRHPEQGRALWTGCRKLARGHDRRVRDPDGRWQHDPSDLGTARRLGMVRGACAYRVSTVMFSRSMLSAARRAPEAS